MIINGTEVLVEKESVDVTETPELAAKKSAARKKKKTAKPVKAKKVAKPVKAKKVAKPAKVKKAGGSGRQSAYAGLHVHKLVATADTGLREGGKVRQCWDAIVNGQTVETYRSKCPESGLGRKVLAEFVVKGWVEVR